MFIPALERASQVRTARFSDHPVAAARKPWLRDCLDQVQKLAVHQGHSPGEKLTLITLAKYGNTDGSSCHPGVRLIAAEQGTSERQVQRYLRGLEKAGTIIPAGTVGGSGKTTVYQINFGLLDDPALKKPPHATIEKGEPSRLEELEFFRHAALVRDALGPERVTSSSEKGDILGSERVTFSAEKGDISGLAIRKTDLLDRKADRPRAAQEEAEALHLAAAQQILEQGRATGKLAFYEECVRAHGSKGCAVQHELEPATGADLEKLYEIMPGLAHLRLGRVGTSARAEERRPPPPD